LGKFGFDLGCGTHRDRWLYAADPNLGSRLSPLPASQSDWKMTVITGFSVTHDLLLLCLAAEMPASKPKRICAVNRRWQAAGEMTKVTTFCRSFLVPHYIRWSIA
jgi:hypothetical protein